MTKTSQKTIQPGFRIGTLTVLRRTSSKRCDVKCDCGNEYSASMTSLSRNSGNGCSKCFRTNFLPKTHGETGSKLHRLWICMRFRCQNPNYAWYSDYGGRGIDVCQEWDDYLVFKKWATENGYSPALSLDRIDNNKGYSPSNCRFTTMKNQARNKRNNKLIEINGVLKPLVEWCEIYGKNRNTIRSRIRAGWSAQRAFDMES